MVFGQVFLLVNEATVKRYKSDLADEIEPVIAELIERAQQGLLALEKKEHSLQTKVIFHITYVFATFSYLS
jgi:DASH complex subunit SPC19